MYHLEHTGLRSEGKLCDQVFPKAPFVIEVDVVAEHITLPPKPRIHDQCAITYTSYSYNVSTVRISYISSQAIETEKPSSPGIQI